MTALAQYSNISNHVKLGEISFIKPSRNTRKHSLWLSLKILSATISKDAASRKIVTVMKKRVRRNDNVQFVIPTHLSISIESVHNILADSFRKRGLIE